MCTKKAVKHQSSSSQIYLDTDTYICRKKHPPFQKQISTWQALHCTNKLGNLSWKILKHWNGKLERQCKQDKIINWLGTGHHSLRWVVINGVGRHPYVCGTMSAKVLQDLLCILSIMNRATGIFLVKQRFSDSCFSLYVEPVQWEKGRYLSIYPVPDLNHRICMLSSKFLVGQPRWILQKWCSTCEQFGKLLELVHCAVVY